MIRFHDFKHGAIDVAGEFPPIPTRKFDYSAVVDGTYDADWDGYAERDVSTTPVGRGETAQEAIEDLLEQLEDEQS